VQREQFWSQATFFTGLRRPEDATRELAIPGTTRKATARFLDGKEVPQRGDARVHLAEWLTGKDNPFFARAVVNRVWDHFFGIGLVDPVDDLTECHPPSHPALLDELARAFVDSGFDLKHLVRAVVSTDAYQMTSVHDRAGPPPELRLFARMNVKAMWPEQLFDSLGQATGLGGLPRQRDQLLGRFPHPEQRLEGQSSIPQALGLMNGELMAQALRTAEQNTISAVADSPYLDNAGRVETLFLAALGRPPSTIERARFVRHVESGDLNRTLGDVFWALLNSAEFRHNH
jgi:Protein of unknown function (DUF1553)